MSISIPEIIAQHDSLTPENITIVGWDVESYYIKNQVLPEIVCFTFYDVRLTQARGYILDPKDGIVQLGKYLRDPATHLVAHNSNFDAITASLLNDQIFALVVNGYDKGRLHCTKLREALLLVGSSDNYGEVSGSIAGRHAPVSRISLAGCLLSYFQKDITASKVGGDAWRLRYHELHGVPVDQWCISAVDYAISDAEFAVAVYLAQEIQNRTITRRLSRAKGFHVDIMKDAQRQAFAEFCLQYMAGKTGVRIDPTKIDDAQADLKIEHDRLIDTIKDFNFYKSAPKEKRGVKKQEAMVRSAFDRVYTILGLKDPKVYSNPNDPTSISLASEPRDNLLRMVKSSLAKGASIITKIPLSADEKEELSVISGAIETYAEIEKLHKTGNTFIKALRNGRLNGDGRIRSSCNGFVSTGRTSWSKPNFQNLPRGGRVRDCIIPQDGHIFIQCDYSNAEMRSLAQENWDTQGELSMLAVEYRKDRDFDPHAFAAAKMYSIEQNTALSYEEAREILADKGHKLYAEIKKLRTLAKILNFGLAGGLSHVGFVSYARGYRVYLSIAESERLCKMWINVWSEMQTYFNDRTSLFREDPMTSEYGSTDAQRTYIFKQSGRARFLRKFTVAANTPFQGMSADGAKSAIIETFKECYFVKSSPLYNSKPVLFVHDELVLETKHDGTPESHARCSQAARRLQAIMERCMEIYTPDIPAVAEPTLTTKWVKDAESDILEDGLIDIWTPKAKAPVVGDDTIEVSSPSQAEIASLVRIREMTIRTIKDLHDNHFSSAAKAKAKAAV